MTQQIPYRLCLNVPDFINFWYVLGLQDETVQLLLASYPKWVVRELGIPNLMVNHHFPIEIAILWAP
jgi:hypothetical protein